MSYTPGTTNTLLTYVLDTLPDPLQASPAYGNIVYAALTFSVANLTGKPVAITKIQFTLPVGADAGDLTKDPYAVIGGANPAGFWNVVMTTPGVYLATPTSGDPITVTTDGIIMQLYNIPVNQKTGPLNIIVTETASDDGNPSAAREATFLIAKFPYGFFFRNFAPDAAQIPVNGDVTLTWEGSEQATYTLTYGETTKPVSKQRSWTATGLTMDTTFLLTAKVTFLGETVTAVLTTTVIVANPEINASAILVTGPATFQSQTIANGPLKANQGITVAGTAALNNNLQVSGTTTLSSLTVNQQLAAGGGINTSQLTTGGLTVNGNGTVTGTLKIGNLSTMGTATTIKTTAASWGATFKAQTDGLVSAFVQPAADFSQWSACMAYLSCNGMTATAQGGSICLYGASTCWNYNLTNSCILPVPAGATFSLTAGYPSTETIFPTIVFYWIPFGNGGYTQVAAEPELPEFIKAALNMVPAVSPDRDYHAPAVRRLMGVLSDLFGEKLNAELKERLNEAVKALVH